MHTCHNDIAELAIDIGEALLINGGEIHRVEDTISRICKSKGAVKTDAFCQIRRRNSIHILAKDTHNIQ